MDMEEVVKIKVTLHAKSVKTVGRAIEISELRGGFEIFSG